MSLHGDCRLKGIINCVGSAHFSQYYNTSIGEIAKINQTNIQSIHYLLKLLYSCKESDCLSNEAFMINVSSAVAKYPNKYSSVYAATKAYHSNLIQIVAKEDRSITFLNLTPWYVSTKMVGYLKSWDTVNP